MNLVAGEIRDRVGITITNSLIIREISYGDQGHYTCIASNVNGDARNSTYVEVISKIFSHLFLFFLNIGIS